MFSGWNDPCSGPGGNPAWEEAIPQNRTSKTHPGEGNVPKVELLRCLQTSIPVSFPPDWTPQTGPFVVLVSQGWWRHPQVGRGRCSQPHTPRKWIFEFWPGLFHPLVLGSCHLLPLSSTSWNVRVIERKALHSLSFVYLHITSLFLLSSHNISILKSQHHFFKAFSRCVPFLKIISGFMFSLLPLSCCFLTFCKHLGSGSGTKHTQNYFYFVDLLVFWGKNPLGGNSTKEKWKWKLFSSM